ncbi:hypothetical protein F5Y16DRAFT_386015 [Xylariaceae sp. FL0255]|nr:hypothetical protein F5Y16DRAFT_386015 [Xylariaceae sp. FL0255]
MAADLARISRPWLLSALRQQASKPNTAVSLSRSSLFIRHAATSNRRSHMAERSANSAQNDRQQQLAGAMAMLLPSTIVPPPMSRWPRNFSQLSHFLYILSANRLINLRSTLGIWFLSATGGKLRWPRPKLKLQRSSAIPAAKALHQQMYEAAAAGDKDSLRRFCSMEWVQHLANGIDRRPKHIKSEWELVEYTNKWKYPRLADFRTGYQPIGTTGMRLVKQAVVSISSVQRLSRYDVKKKGERLVGGDEKEMIEHVVIQSVIDEQTWECGPWRVWGVLPEQTYEQMANDRKLFQEVMGM